MLCFPLSTSPQPGWFQSNHRSELQNKIEVCGLLEMAVVRGHQAGAQHTHRGPGAWLRGWEPGLDGRSGSVWRKHSLGWRNHLSWATALLRT